MRSCKCLSLVVIAALALTAINLGCSPEGVPGSDENLDARLSAAEDIQNPKAEDKALAKVATDSAGVGDSQVASEALQRMKSVKLHDDTAATCAAKLGWLGYRSAANEIASTINDPSQRDKVMKNLAQ